MQQSLGRKIVNFLGMSSLGQTGMDDSLPVTIASDQILRIADGIKSTVFKVNNNPLEISTAIPVVTTPEEDRTRIIIQNVHPSGNLFVGLSGVTTSTGYKLVPGATLDIPTNDTTLLYVISDAAANAMAVRIIEFV